MSKSVLLVSGCAFSLRPSVGLQRGGGALSQLALMSASQGRVASSVRGLRTACSNPLILRQGRELTALSRNEHSRALQLSPMNNNEEMGVGETGSDGEECRWVGDSTLTRHWDGFWKNGIKIKRHQSRRHIVMVYSMKQSMNAMRRWAETHCQLDALEALYNDLLEKYSVNQSDEDQAEWDSRAKFVHVEQRVFKLLLNMKCNVFIGASSENRAMSDIANLFEMEEGNLFTLIEKAPTSTALAAELRTWCDDYLPINGSGLKNEYWIIRHRTAQNIHQVLIPQNDNRDLEQIKLDKKDDVMAVSDSVMLDLSKSSHPELRYWQNMRLIPMQKAFLDVVEAPNLPAFETLLRTYLDLEQEGVELLGLQKSELDNFARHPKAVAAFKRAITCR